MGCDQSKSLNVSDQPVHSQGGSNGSINRQVIVDDHGNFLTKKTGEEVQGTKSKQSDPKLEYNNVDSPKPLSKVDGDVFRTGNTCDETHSSVSHESLLEEHVSEYGDSIHSYASGGSGSFAHGSLKSTEVKIHDSNHSRRSGMSRCDGMTQSTSVIGLDKMIEVRREEGDLVKNMVHMEVPFGKPIEEVYDGVHYGRVLGSGISGLVRLATHKATGVKYAVKCLDLGLVDTEESLRQLREEIFIMCQLDHPNIVRLEEVYESHSEIYLVQELCMGGELFDRLDDQPDYHYTEESCARLVKQMLCSVRYIHSKGIIHRDLKLENFLFSSHAEDSELKMIDFGLSKHFSSGEVQNESVGTPYTVAPEVIRRSYDERCDLWSIGVITYLLLSGDPPFGGCGGPEPLTTVRANILSGKFKFEPEEIWSNVSAEAKDFISQLLVTDPEIRPTSREAQKSKWLRQWANTAKMRDKSKGKLNPNVVKALVNFKEYSDMRKLLCEVLSFTLLPDQIIELRKEFEKMDTDGSGEISFKSLRHVLMQNAGEGMLGGLTEKEVADIFDAMRVRKSETTIHWHEFIAAGLSQCKVDDRNLRLAFNRLDSDHKNYITFDDVLDLMGNDATEDSLKEMYIESLDQCQCQHSRITYEDFLLLMKGQSKPRKQIPDGVTHEHSRITYEDFLLLMKGQSKPRKQISGGVLHSPVVNTRKLSVPVPLFNLDECGKDIAVPMPTLEETSEPSSSPLEKKKSMFLENNIDESDNCPVMLGDYFDTMPPEPTLLEGRSATVGAKSMESIKKSIITEAFTSPNESSSIAMAAVRRMPQEINISETILSGRNETSKPLMRAVLSRHRSKSVDMGENDTLFDGEEIVEDDLRSTLAVNREIYRSHRRLRLAVLEASKRFEEEQVTRTKHQLKEGGLLSEDGQMVESGAGLVMRRGHKRNKQLSSEIETVRKILQVKQEEEQKQLEQVNKKVGRGRRSRKKVVSDMSGMMSSPLTKEEKSFCINMKPIDISNRTFGVDITPIQESARETNVIKKTQTSERSK
eukprot:CAMPEP_0194444248 /NCGR_PEP_ID=MMETSP0176-20130528/127161_1 /TAXON_ID=216777 /ORGANISM="Proboscia alata, Strain PI-D3" /LENGTH=1036 /DNA_ID=CAMNT_0039270601 /DNA_START=128 /DNA_END=3238 /DNA_ORIENTATION=+